MFNKRYFSIVFTSEKIFYALLFYVTIFIFYHTQMKNRLSRGSRSIRRETDSRRFESRVRAIYLGEKNLGMEIPFYHFIYMVKVHPDDVCTLYCIELSVLCTLLRSRLSERTFQTCRLTARFIEFFANVPPCERGIIFLRQWKSHPFISPLFNYAICVYFSDLDE